MRRRNDPCTYKRVRGYSSQQHEQLDPVSPAGRNFEVPCCTHHQDDVSVPLRNKPPPRLAPLSEFDLSLRVLFASGRARDKRRPSTSPLQKCCRQLRVLCQTPLPLARSLLSHRIL